MSAQDLTQFNSQLPTFRQQSTDELQNLKRLKEANEHVMRVFKACQDFDRCTDHLVAMASEYVATLAPEMQRRVCSAAEGVLTLTKFLPTVAEFKHCADLIKERDDRYRPTRATGYKYFGEETAEEQAIEAGKGSPERRKAFIQRMKARYPVCEEAAPPPARKMSDEDMARLMHSYDVGMAEKAENERRKRAKTFPQEQTA